jgi:hypothetical protein
MSDAFVNLAGRPVIELRMGLPRVGVWWAQIALAEGDAPPTGRLTLSVGNVPFVGTVKRSDVSFGTPTILMAAGAAGLSVRLAPKSYRQQSLKLVLGDILAAAGESLSAQSDAGVLGSIIPSWSTANHLGGAALATLLEYVPKTSWRFLQDGTLWVGPETWPEASVDDAEVMEDDIIRRRTVFFAPCPSVLPGQRFMGRNVGYVEHRLRDGALRTEATFEAAA